MLASLTAALRLPDSLRDDFGSGDPSEDALQCVPGGVPGGVPAWGVPPVLQYVPVPVTINAERFRNAAAPSHPKGDVLALRALRDLVDPLPTFSSFYVGQGSTESFYSAIVRGAVAREENPFARYVISNCQRLLATQSMADLGPMPGSWGPVYATPADWAEATALSRFDDLEIDLTGDGDGQPAFATIGRQASPRLFTQDAAHPLDVDTHLRALRMKYLFVSLQRPWMDSTIFDTRGWQLGGQGRGFCSSGDLHRNSGAMPLLPLGFIVARDVELDAQWGDQDQQILDREMERGVSLGPIPLSAGATGSTLHVIAWVSRLLPLSPEW